MSDITTEIIKEAADNIDSKFFSLVYKDAAQPGVKQVGKALATVLGLGNTALLPIKLLNSKAQAWYAKHMEDYRQRLESTPEEKIIEVAPEIGVPILEKLEKTTQGKISELYINLLSNASTIDLVANTHPRFIAVIENLTTDEVKILEMFKLTDICVFINIIINESVENVKLYEEAKYPYPNNVVTLTTNKRATMLEKSTYLSIPDKSKFYFENLISLGLIEATEEFFMATANYNTVIQAFDEEIKSTNTVAPKEVVKGYYYLTEFGKLFLKACQQQ